MLLCAAMKGQALALVGMLGSLWTAKQNLRFGLQNRFDTEG